MYENKFTQSIPTLTFSGQIGVLARSILALGPYV